MRPTGYRPALASSSASSLRATKVRRRIGPIRPTMVRAVDTRNLFGQSSSGKARKSLDRAGVRYRKSTSAFSGVARRAPDSPRSSKPKKNDGWT